MPNGFLLCNGASVSRSDYPDLADALGETGTTFSLPDYRDRVPQGAGTVSPNVSVSAGLPEIHGAGRVANWVLLRNNSTARWADNSGAMTDVTTGFAAWAAAESTDQNESGERYTSGFSFDASNYDSIYSSGATVQPPAIATHFLIKS